MQNKKNKVAVLLATYNGEKHIGTQLQSIAAQKNVVVSLFVSDDQSTDSTQSLLNKNYLKNITLTVLPSTRLGGAAANFFRLLRIVNFSDVDYVAFADQDDIWDFNKLSTAILKIEEEEVDAYSGNVTAFWPNGEKRLIKKSQQLKRWDFLFESAGPGCTFVLTKNLALEIQKFLNKNEQTTSSIDLHDWFIYAFARSHGYKWFIDEQSFMLYRQHHANAMGANIGLRAKIKRIKRLTNGWYINQIISLAELLEMDHCFPVKQLKRLNLIDRLLLISNIRQFRRKFWDSIALVLIFLLPKK